MTWTTPHRQRNRTRSRKWFSASVKVLSAIASGLVLAGCATLPEPGSREIILSPVDTHESALARQLVDAYGAERMQGLADESVRPQSGFVLLKDGRKALEARLALAREAEHTLDLQTFELLDQNSSWLIMAHLMEAAERGVSVRLLVDDWGNDFSSSWLARLATHPNIEVRIFNPFPLRPAWRLNYVTHFSRVHRRMHNKTFVADNQVAILGGRNTGDAYYEASEERIFLDLDILTLGPITPEVSGAFDLYWNHHLAVDAESVSQGRKRSSLGTMQAEFSELLPDEHSSWAWDDISPIWAPAVLYVDDPGKILRAASDTTGHLVPRLLSEQAMPEREVLFVTPYFVPGDFGLDLLAELVDEGIEIDLLTNSLAANNMPIVHSGYAPYRRELLEKGVRLWEVQPTPWSTYEMDNDTPWQSVVTDQVTLHAKVWVFDRERVFIGSVNMDPRSFQHNTEIGLMIDSPELASEILDWMEPMKNSLAWKVRLEENGDKEWVEMPDVEGPGAEARAIAHYDPDSSWWRRVRTGLYTFLPIEFLL